MLGLLIDPEEFEVKPAIKRALLLTEFLDTKNYSRKSIYSDIEIKVTVFEGDGIQTIFSVGESIGVLFFVAINGLVQDQDVDYYWLGGTSRVSFVQPPKGRVMVVYYAGKSNVFKDSYGNLLAMRVENFMYDGTSPTFTVNNVINSVIYVTINGLVDINGDGYTVGPNPNQITFNTDPVNPSRISVCYLY